MNNFTDWSYTVAAQTDILPDRGFTGHEYLPWFKLYNMNGRLYDPVVGRFLEPDPVIQDASSTQNLNRYSYALNNPLKYVDPSGYKMFNYLSDTYDYEGGGFWYRGDYYRYNSEVGGGQGGFVASNGSGGQQSVYQAKGYEQTTDYFNAYKNKDGDWVITSYSRSETKYWNEWELTGYVYPSGGNATNGWGMPDWGNTAIDHTSKTVGGLGLLTKGRELVEWEYLRLAKFNRGLSGDFSQPVKHSLRALKNTGKVLGYTGVALSGVDMAVNGVNVSNSLDLVMGGVAFIPGFGWAVSGLYFVGNFGWQAYSGKTIGESIQSNFTDPNTSWKPW